MTVEVEVVPATPEQARRFIRDLAELSKAQTRNKARESNKKPTR